MMKRLIAAAGALALAACGGEEAAAPEAHSVSITARVPAGTPTVYLTGNLPELGPWNAAGLAMAGEGRERTVALPVPHGTVLEYKFTLGSWEREGLGPSGMVMANFRLEVDGPASAEHEIADFKKPVATYIEDWEGSGVEGRLVYWTDVASAFLSETRHVEIWLPPGYDENPEKRYRVVYMSDGQNLFDPRIANTGVDWGVDEAMMRGARDELYEPAIVVGAWSSSRRGYEYSPWHGAPDYARFLIEELMPRVDAEFRTLTGPENTFHMGSSMGGLLSLYLIRTRPDVFSACGCVSTHTPLSPTLAARYIPGAEGDPADDRPYILADIEAGLAMPKGQRLFFDHGTETLDAEYGPGHEAICGWLAAQGFVEGEEFLIRVYAGAAHNETAWRARVGDQLKWLLAPQAE
ncbi:MAG: alpha/beta hydrolase-fold protein [Pseudomonadota bacterium]